MKVLKIYFAFFLFSTFIQLSAQEFITSSVHISRGTGETISSSENEFSVIKLNNQTNLFSVDLCVLLGNTNEADSVPDINRQLSLDFRGIFPIDDLDFYNLEGKEGRIYTIIGELTINGIKKSFTKMNFTLHRSNYPNSFVGNIESYDSRISFILEIDPIDFCLDNIIENCPKTITVEVDDGVINKLTNGNQKIECDVTY